jgi:1-aminocyclopropane-1-carboxylate synthase
VKPIMVDMADIDPTGTDAVARYENKLQENESDEHAPKIRALMLANPHNPLGRCYTREALEAYLKLCAKYNIHLISDEVYAMSVFANDDVPNPLPFVSILSFDTKQYIDPSLVHMLYGMSKDFCSNGLLVGALVSQANPGLSGIVAASKLAWASSMSQYAWARMLKDDDFLETFFGSYRCKLRAAYERCTRYLEANRIPYEQASAGPFIWIDLSQHLQNDSLTSECELAWKIFRHRLFLATGETYFAEQNGRFRLTFALPAETMTVAFER